LQRWHANIDPAVSGALLRPHESVGSGAETNAHAVALNV